MHYAGDEAEEGEVYDGSDQEEADSDQNATADASPRHLKFPSQGSRLRSNTTSGYAKFDPHYRRFPGPHGPLPRPFLHPRSNDHPPPIRPLPQDSGPFMYEASQNNSYDERLQVSQHDSSHSTEPNVPYTQEPLGPPPHYPLHPDAFKGPPPFPFPRPQLPCIPAPPLTAVGSQEEIERMHQMYQKACEFYERAAAKVVSAGLNLPLAVPPKPPPVSLLIPQPVPPQPAPPAQRSVDSSTAHFPIPSADSNAPPVIKSSETCVAPPTPQPEIIVPPTTLPSTDASTYSLAYAAAYKQTVGTIPAPENGGPAPNTPEYSALWQRYMDYYLRYYMQAYATLAPNGSTKSPDTITNQPEATSASSTKTNVSSASGEDKPSLPKTTETKVVDNSPASKRPKVPDQPAAEVVKAVGDKESSVPDKKSNSQAAHSTEPSAEVPKAGPPAGNDDIKSSKCIWISNLPQGVKAVDVKERCTPFGRVQTIKIIGSRKSTPPSIYAYLVMESVEAATRLVEGLQGAKFDNQEIKVKRINALPIP